MGVEKFPERKPQREEKGISRYEVKQSNEEWQEALLRCYGRQEEVNAFLQESQNSMRGGSVALAEQVTGFEEEP